MYFDNYTMDAANFIVAKCKASLAGGSSSPNTTTSPPRSTATPPTVISNEGIGYRLCQPLLVLTIAAMLRSRCALMQACLEMLHPIWEKSAGRQHGLTHRVWCTLDG